MAEIEIYPGFRLDFLEIKGEVFKQKVLPFLGTISDLNEQIDFLEILLNHHELEIGDNAQDYEERRRRSRIARAFDDEMYDQIGAREKYLIRAKEFEDKCKRRLDHLKKTLEMETRRAKQDATEEETKGMAVAEKVSKARQDQLDAVYFTLAICAMLEGVGLPEDMKAAPIAKFIAKLTGVHYQTIAPFVPKARGEGLSPEQYEFVAKLFDELKLERLRNDMRRLAKNPW